MVSNPSYRINRLENKVFAAGSTVQIQTAGQIAPGRRIQAVVFRLDIDITQAAAATAQLGSVLHQLIAQFKMGRLVSITGLGLHYLDWLMMGKACDLPAGLPATNNGVFSRSILWTLRFSDLTSMYPNDGAIPAEMFTDPIEVRFGTTAIFAANVPALSNGTLTTYVVHDAASVEPDQAVVPASVAIKTVDFSALTAVINETGAWLYALIFREASNDAGGITSAQVPQFTSYIDGEPIINNALAQGAASNFNTQRAAGTAYQVESTTVPVPGARIQDAPGVAAAAGQGVTLDFLPLVFPCKPYSARKQVPIAQVGFKNEVGAGATLTTYKIAYRLAELRPVNAIADGARRMGMPTAVYRPHTWEDQVTGLNAGLVSQTLPAGIKGGK